MNRLTNISLAAWLAVDAYRSLIGAEPSTEGGIAVLTGMTLLLLAVCVLLRLPPAAQDRSRVTWLVTLGSLFLPAVYLLLPPAAPSTGVQCLRLVSALGFAWSALTLRTHFSVLPQHRGVVSSGPYRFMRHPMYACYLLFDATYCVPDAPPVFRLIWGIELLLLLLRARREEDFLRRADPRYKDYMQRVPSRFIPGIPWTQLLESPQVRSLQQLALLLLAAEVVYWGWPTSAYLLGVGAVYLGVFKILSRPGPASASSPRRARALHQIGQAVLACLGSVLCGLAVVCVAQTLLELFVSTQQQMAVRQVELWLCHALQVLRAYRGLGPKDLFILLVILSLLVILLPQLQLGQRFATLRRVSGRALLTLQVVATFSFFATGRVQQLEQAWIAQSRSATREALQRADRDRAELAAAALLGHAAWHLPDPTIHDLGTYFHIARDQGMSGFARDRLASHLGARQLPASRSGATAAESKDRAPSTERDLESIRAWSEGVSGIEVRLDEVHEVQQSAERLGARTRELKRALRTVLAGLIGVGADEIGLLCEQLINEIKPKLAPRLPKTPMTVEKTETWAWDQGKAGDALTPKWEILLTDEQKATEALPLDTRLERFFHDERMRVFATQNQKTQEPPRSGRGSGGAVESAEDTNITHDSATAGQALLDRRMGDLGVALKDVPRRAPTKLPLGGYDVTDFGPPPGRSEPHSSLSDLAGIPPYVGASGGFAPAMLVNPMPLPMVLPLR